MTVALVTGSNRGIGLEVVRQLAQQDDMTVILTARSMEKAKAASDELVAEGLTVVPMIVDVGDAATITKLAADVEAEYGKLDILVNNAAAFNDWSETASTADLDAAHNALEINLFGAWRMAQAFLPLLRHSDHPRLVNVSSGGGSHADMQFGLTANNGASASYGISKAAMNALTAKLAAELADTPILVNSVCPGLTATAPGMEAMGARPVAEGAKSVVWGALLPDDGPRGGFFRDGEPLGW